MSSAVLYLAIVAVWGVVLVPMWLRRDGDGISRLLHRRHDEPEHEETSLHEPAVHESVPVSAHEPAHEDEDAAEFEVPVTPSRRTGASTAPAPPSWPGAAVVRSASAC